MTLVSKKSTHWIILFFLCVIGIEFYIYSYDPVLRGDEAAYCYVLDWENNGWGLGYGIGDDLTRIQSIGDVVSSQVDHYKHWGGRSLVHAVEQFFSGVSSPGVFYIINTFVFLLTLLLLVLVSVGTKKIEYLAPWFFATLGMMYILPWSMYILTSINLSCNYLWPMTGLLLVVYIWYRVKDTNKRYPTIAYFGLFLLSLIAGWSHEAYCLGMSGAFFFYYLFNHKKFIGIQRWIVIGYWFGTLVLFCAPGNFYRLSQGEDKNLSYLFFEFILSLPRLKVVYIFLLSLLYFRLKRRDDFNLFIRRYNLLIISWGLSLIFVCLFHTVSQSFTGIEILSLLLTLCLIQPIFNGKHNTLYSFLMLLLCVHMGMVCIYQFNQNESERNALEKYAESKDGLSVNYTTECQNPLVSYWLRHPMDNFRIYPLVEKIYADNPKHLILITPQDELLIKNSDTYFKEQNRFGTGPFYAIDGCSKAWAPVDSNLLNRTYLLNFDNPHFYEQMPMKDRVWALINPSKVSKVGPAQQPQILDTRYGRFMVINIPTQRKVIGISLIDQ